jgi:hypothetical protein
MLGVDGACLLVYVCIMLLDGIISCSMAVYESVDLERKWGFAFLQGDDLLLKTDSVGLEL